MNRHFKIYKDSNGGTAPPLHPILAALSIVLDRNEDFANITVSHPHLRRHVFYDPDVPFPQDISYLLPPQEKRWWEHIPAVSRSVSSHPGPISAGGSPPPAGGFPPFAGGSPSPAGGSRPPAGGPLPLSVASEEQQTPADVECGAEEEEEEDQLVDEEPSRRLLPKVSRPKVSSC